MYLWNIDITAHICTVQRPTTIITIKESVH
jgi:hypothetical protein